MKLLLTALLGTGVAMGSLGIGWGADPSGAGGPGPPPGGKAAPLVKPPAPHPGRDANWVGVPYPGYGWPAYGLVSGYPCLPYQQGPVIFAPVYLPAEVLYGPEPVWRLMGVGHWFGPPGRVKVEAQRPEEAAAEGDQDRPAAQRGSNPETLALAGRFVALGDQMFHKRKYVEANGRYRTAAQIAPGLAEAHFRQGFALVATGRYEAAAKAFKRGLEIEPDWADSDFRLESLYGANEADKAAHFERLAEAAARQAPNADLLFVIGVCLHFDGQAQRALAFFRRAAQLAGANRTHLKGFLKGPGPDPAEK